MSSILIFLHIFFFTASNIFPQVDSVKTYKLNEVKVQSSILIEPKPVIKIEKEIIQNSDAVSLSEISKQIPSVKVQNNSRGESQIYFRGSSSRQLTLFFDGVPLNIPWDNRIDLSLLPTNAIGSIEITKGIPSTVYGPNTISGVVDIFSLSYSKEKNKQIKIMGGENYFQSYSGYWSDKIDNLQYLFSLSYFSTDGFTLPASFNDSENENKLRINSSVKTINGFAKIGYEFSHNSKISLSLSSKNSTKNVPPEIDVNRPRFWRYPEWQHNSLIINGSHGIFEGSNISYSFSATKFNMQIDQYQSIDYKLIDDIERNNDLTYYGRVLYSSLIDNNSIIKFIASGLSSYHTEEFLSSGWNQIEYSQRTFSIGTEYEYLSNGLFTILGISLDGQSTPQTGVFPVKDPIFDLGANLSVMYNFSPSFSTQLSFGRKTRFPTLREMFSGALGKFIPNPNLKSEVAYSSELGLNYHGDISTNKINFFLSYISDGIVRTTVSDITFKRINEDKIRSFGIEITNQLNLVEYLKIIFNFSYLNSFAQNSNGSFIDTLEYKPKFVINGDIFYSISKNIKFSLEINYIGEEYGIKDGANGLKKLNNYLLSNLKLSYKFPVLLIGDADIFIRVNNIFDKLYYTQWGLPEAGRQFFIGTSLTF